MARQSKGPWYWRARDGWYVQIDGHQIKLATGRKARAEAERVYHARMAERHRVDSTAEPPPVPELGAVLVAYLREAQRRVERGELATVTWSSYRDRLKSAGPALGAIPVDQLTEGDVARWLDAHPAWGATRRHDAVAALKAVTAWAARRWPTPVADPLKGLAKPRRNIRRETIPTADEVRRLLDAVIDHRARIFLEFVVATGCRPGEAARVEARHFDAGRRVLSLPAHKTRHKTGLPRMIVLDSAWGARIAALAQVHPAGPLFRNCRELAWTGNAWKQQVEGARTRAGLGPHVVAYALRHRRITDLLLDGTPLTLVAQIAGHAAATTTARIYAHAEQAVDAMRAALDRTKAG
jgi:integrase